LKTSHKSKWTFAREISAEEIDGAKIEFVPRNEIEFLVDTIKDGKFILYENLTWADIYAFRVIDKDYYQKTKSTEDKACGNIKA